MKNMQVVIAGGGIGGLSLGLSLHQAGIAVRMYEAVHNPAPLGAGINLQPTAVRELTELGLADALAEVGLATQELSYFNKFGQLICSEPRGLPAGYRWPQYSIHRGKLQMLLLRALRKRIGPENSRSGLRFTKFEQRGDRVRVWFRDSDGVELLDDADVLVGADGIHSAVRGQLYPAEGEPRFAKQLLWRATVDAEPFLGGRTMIIAGHFHQRIIVYPVGKAATRGKLVTNLICQITAPNAAPPREDWNRRVEKEKVLEAFGGWRFPWLDTRALIEQSPGFYEFPLVDRDPVSAWTHGRVTLIGDAAHPMQPVGSQAGSQAIVDARALTGALTATSDPIEALAQYDGERRPLMNDITLRNRGFGPESAMQLVEERAPHGFVRIGDVISREELDSIAGSFAAAAGLDVEAVNSRPSFVRPTYATSLV